MVIIIVPFSVGLWCVPLNRDPPSQAKDETNQAGTHEWPRQARQPSSWGGVFLECKASEDPHAYRILQVRDY